MWESVTVLRFVVRYFMSILVLKHLDWEERAGCIAWFVFLVSRDCCVTLPRSAMALSAVCDCAIPDNTHLLFFSWLPSFY